MSGRTISNSPCIRPQAIIICCSRCYNPNHSCESVIFVSYPVMDQRLLWMFAFSLLGFSLRAFFFQVLKIEVKFTEQKIKQNEHF